MRGLVFLQQGGTAEHLVTGGALVEVFGVNLMDVLLMLLQRGEAEAATLAVVRLGHIWSTGNRNVCLQQIVSPQKQLENNRI